MVLFVFEGRWTSRVIIIKAFSYTHPDIQNYKDIPNAVLHKVNPSLPDLLKLQLKKAVEFVC